MRENMIPDEINILLCYGGAFLSPKNSERIYWRRIDREAPLEGPNPRFLFCGRNKGRELLPSLTERAWRIFYDRLKEIGVFSWHGDDPSKFYSSETPDYATPHWSLEIAYQGGETFEVSGTMDKRPEWFRDFCGAVSELVGGRPFGEDLL